LLGIGDDGAIVRPDAGRELVVVADTLVEGVHFPRNMDASDIGYRVVAVNLSDIAAMAARPRWMTLAITLAANDSQWLERFSLGFHEIADQYSVVLVGGDTTRGRETVVTVQIIGDVDPGAAIRRSGARPGDAIYVTGTPGDAAGGLALWQSNAVHGEDATRLYRRFARPTPRVSFAARLAKLASAAIDVSDGLYADIGKLLAASRAAGRIDVDCLSLSAPLTAIHGKETAMQFALGGGDDYEIAFTAPQSGIASIVKLADECALQVTRIGEVIAGSGLSCYRGGHPIDYQHPGYRHFD
jgi:thiamine-monophosphate kinase